MSKEIATTKNFYDKFAEKWSNTKTFSFHHEKQFRKILGFWPEKGKIIDIGCADGIHLPLFLGMGHKLKYFGIDISKSFLKIAQSRYPQMNFALADISDQTTLPKTKFDGFWAGAVLMHIPFSKWNEMFSNIETMMRPGAYGYISLPTEHPSQNILPEDTRHFTTLTKLEQEKFFKDRHWKIKAKGAINGSSKSNIWHWYIVELPKK